MLTAASRQHAVDALEADHDREVSIGRCANGVVRADGRPVQAEGHELGGKSRPDAQDVVRQKNEAGGLASIHQARRPRG